MEPELNNDIDLDLDEALEGTPAEDAPEIDELPAAEIPQEQVDEAFKPVAVAPEPVTPKTMGHGIKDAPKNGLSLSERAARTKLILSQEPKVSTIIPLQGGEKMGAVKVVNINGYRFEIKKNVPVNLPKSVWKIVMQSMKASLENTANHPLNLSNAPEDRKKALGLV